MNERLRGISESQVDRGYEALRGTRRGLLPWEGIAQVRGGIPAVVSIPLPRALLLRSPRGPRLHDGAGIRERTAIAIRAQSSSREETAGRHVESRRGPSGRRGRRGGVECETSEAGADPVRFGETRRAKQDDHAEGHAGVETSRRIGLMERSGPRIACA